MIHRSLNVACCLAVTIPLAFAALPAPALAQEVLVSSLELAPGRDSPDRLKGLFSDAQLIRTDNRRWQLISITVRVGNLNDPDQTLIKMAELRADNNVGNGQNLPVAGSGNVLTDFTFPDLTGDVSDRDFTANKPVILEANTNYWFVLGTFSSAEDPRSFDWAFSAGGATQGTGSLALPGASTSRFALSDNGMQGWVGVNDTPFFIQVNGIAVSDVSAPEPSALALMTLAGLPVLALPLLRRRVMRRKSDANA